MSGKLEHENAVAINQDLIDLLYKDDVTRRKFSHWIVVILFYKAVHMIEAIFAERGGVPHLDVNTGERRSDYDDRRNGMLIRRTEYKPIYEPFDALRRLSYIARYSGCGIDSSGNPIAYDSDKMLSSAELYASTIEDIIKRIRQNS